MTTELSIEVGILRANQERTTLIFEKISSNIDAISEVEKHLSKIIAVHDEKFKNQDKTNVEMVQAIERVGRESKELFKESIAKIEKTQAEAKVELTSFRTEVIDELKSLRDDTIKNSKDNASTTREELDDLEKRISTLEQWRYYIVGIMAVVAWGVTRVVEFLSK